MFCESGAYSKIKYNLTKNEVTKINLRQYDFLGIQYPAEYDITCRLNHPHLLKAKRINKKGYLVFPYYRYTLWNDEILELPIPERKKLLHQLLTAVDALHKAGYLHLDIKGNNALINETKDHLVLADFGSALFVGPDGAKSSPKDRIIDDLKAPELLLDRIEKKREITYRRASDYWSLGLLCIDVLKGKVDCYGKKTLEQIYDEKKSIFGVDGVRENYLREIIPNDIEWQGILRNLLAWDWQKRTLEVDNPKLDLSITQIHPPLLWSEKDYKEAIISAVKEWIVTCGTERVEAFFLATDLFHRLCYLKIPPRYLLLGCYWIALKIVEGASVDPREIEPDNEKIDDLWKLELTLIKELKGRLYYPNLFTQAQSIDDLITAWWYLYGRRGLREELDPPSLKKCPVKGNLTLANYLYKVGLIC